MVVVVVVVMTVAGRTPPHGYRYPRQQKRPREESDKITIGGEGSLKSHEEKGKQKQPAEGVEPEVALADVPLWGRYTSVLEPLMHGVLRGWRC